jgi:hypothetical protein
MQLVACESCSSRSVALSKIGRRLTGSADHSILIRQDLALSDGGFEQLGMFTEEGNASHPSQSSGLVRRESKSRREKNHTI